MSDQADNTPAEGFDASDAVEAPESGGSPWDFGDAPEELLPYLQEAVKKAEGGVTRKFQEHAEFRKQMEPLAPLAEIEGLSDVDPDELGMLLEFREIASDPEQFEDWWTQVGEQLGFFASDDSDDSDEQGGYDEQDIPPAWQEQFQSMQQQIEMMQAALGQQESQTREQQTEQMIASSLDALKAEHGEFDEDAVCSLAMAYTDDPQHMIEKGFADYQRIIGGAQSQLVDQAQQQPGLSVGGGGADTAPEKVSDFNTAKELAKARFAG